MPARDARPSFNAGEISDEADARFDLSKYAAGCEVLENFMPMPTGGARKRPGLVYVSETKNSGSSAARVVPFRFSTGTNFILLFEAGSIRFFSNRVQVTLSGSAYEVANPYTESQIFDLHFTQINDVVYVTHPDVAPYKLSRYANTDWTFEEVVWDYPPLLSLNTASNLTIKATIDSATSWATVAYSIGDVVTESGNYYRCLEPHTGSVFATDLAANKWRLTGGELNESVTLEAEATAWGTTTAYYVGDHVEQSSLIYKCLVAHTSGTFATDLAAEYWEEVEVFTSGNVGGYFELSHPREVALVEITNLDANATETSDSIRVIGAVNITTTGTWDGTLNLQQSKDSGTTWSTIRTYDSQSDYNVETSINFDSAVLLRWDWTRGSAPASGPNPRAIIQPAPTNVEGIVRIDTVTDGAHATGTVTSDLDSATATQDWKEGAWSTRRGFPRTSTLHEQRLTFAATTHQAQTVWFSGTDDYEDFRFGTAADDAFSVTIGSTNFNGIRWMQSKDRLLLGTTGGEFTISPASDSNPLSPTNVSIDNDSNFGSATVQPVLLNEAVLYVARANASVMELSYAYATDKYVSPELTLLASHITRSGVTQMDVQRGRWSTLYAVTGDGYIAGMTYERPQDVVAWWKMRTAEGDTLESVACVYGDTDDEVWVVAKRAKGDGSGYVRTVEYLDINAWPAQDIRDFAGTAFCDSAVVYDGVATTSITVPSFMVGRTVQVLSGNSVEDEVVPTTTTVTVPSGTKIVVGLKYEAKIQPTRPEVQLGNGSSSGSKKRISSVAVKLKDSGYVNLYKHTDATLSNPVLITLHQVGDLTGVPPALKTGVVRESVQGDWEFEPGMFLLSDSPTPCTVLGLVQEFSVGQRT